ncbi:MAG TPA: response regulator transcription factor [Campylobacterales bacterium]|nr:response regulator transcription factor [Campylobacterales bacterium]
MKILLLEDDQLLNDAITKFLTIEGHLVNTYRDGQSAHHALSEASFDLLILDINVPNINGLALLETLHNEKIEIPTIFISAIIDIDDISRAFDLGCYDYLKKPFHLKELSIRINKILQSRYVPKEHLRLSHNYSYDMDSSTLRFNNEVQILSHRQIQIIELLASNRSRIVNYDMFKDYVWNDLDIDNATIRAEINRLKKILKDDCISNIRSIGYMIERPD